MSTPSLPRALALPIVAALIAAAPARGDFRLEKQLALAPGGELVVDVQGGAVTVTGGAGEGATILVTSRRDDVDERFTFDFTAEPGRVEVKSKRRGSWTQGWFGWGDRLHFEVRVPRQTKVDLHSSGGGIRISTLAGNARLRTSGGGLRVSDLNGDLDGRTSGGGVEVRLVNGSVRVETSGGGIHVDGVAGSVQADTSGGGIEIDSVGGDVLATTSGGGVRIRGVHGRVEAESSGGPVSAVFAAGSSAGGSLSSSGGGVRVAIDPAAALSIDASSSGGGVDWEVPLRPHGRVSRNSVRGDLNGGGATLLLRSSGGGIDIDSLGADG
jgi:hypothetical protein